MLSTSSDLTRGLFYEATQEAIERRPKLWSVHEWQWSDNPYVREEMQATIDKLIDADPLIIETPHFQQHYLNKWVVDTTNRVYKFSRTRNLATEYPGISERTKSAWTFVLGIDLGWEDETAFVLTAYHEHDPNLYVIKTHAAKHMTFDDVVAKTNSYLADVVLSPSRIIIDGANKQGVESMISRSGIPFEQADKNDKSTFIELLNADFITGKIKLLDGNETLARELEDLIWTTDATGKVKFPKKEHPRIPNHRADALLYAWRMGYHYQFSEPVKKVVKGSQEWYKEQAVGIWERERERLEAQDQRGLWPEDSGFPDDFQ